MEIAKFWLLTLQCVVIFCCFALTACKIFKSKSTDRYILTILGMVAVLLFVQTISMLYVYCSKKRSNYNKTIDYSIFTVVEILMAVLSWEFSWGLFTTSIEIEERLKREPHWFKKIYRIALNVFVLCLIFVCLIVSDAFGNYIL